MNQLPRHQWTDAFLTEQFDRALQAGAGLVHQAAPFRIEIEEAEDGARKINGVASVEAVSRSGHKFLISGIQIEQYNQLNPVVLACHRQFAAMTLMPGAIATVEKVSKYKDTLRFRGMEFDTDALAQAWEQKVRKNIVRMVSIGVTPLDWGIASETVGRGATKREIRYIEVAECELTELSLVVVGANRGAYIDRQSGQETQRLDALEQKFAALLAELNSLREQFQPPSPGSEEDADVARLSQAAEAALSNLAHF